MNTSKDHTMSEPSTVTHEVSFYLVPLTTGRVIAHTLYEDAKKAAKWETGTGMVLKHVVHITLPEKLHDVHLIQTGSSHIEYPPKTTNQRDTTKPDEPEWDYNPPGNYVLTRDDEAMLVREEEEGIWEPVIRLRGWSAQWARDAGYKCRRKINPQPTNDPTTPQYSPGG